jgi:hypothetical protein
LIKSQRPRRTFLGSVGPAPTMVVSPPPSTMPPMTNSETLAAIADSLKVQANQLESHAAILRSQASLLYRQASIARHPGNQYRQGVPTPFSLLERQES